MATGPTGDRERGLGAGSVGFTLFLLATKELGPWAFNFNTGYIRNENKIDETQDIWHLSLSGQYKMGKSLSLVADAGLERNTDPDSGTPPAFTIVGFIYSVREGFDVDLGINMGSIARKRIGQSWRGQPSGSEILGPGFRLRRGSRRGPYQKEDPPTYQTKSSCSSPEFQ